MACLLCVFFFPLMMFLLLNFTIIVVIECKCVCIMHISIHLLYTLYISTDQHLCMCMSNTEQIHSSGEVSSCADKDLRVPCLSLQHSELRCSSRPRTPQHEPDRKRRQGHGDLLAITKKNRPTMKVQ